MQQKLEKYAVGFVLTGFVTWKNIHTDTQLCIFLYAEYKYKK